MRLAHLLAPSLLVSASVVLVSCAPQAGVVGANTRNVGLRVGCSGDSVTFSFSPWRVRVELGDVIDWNLTVTAGTVPEFGIEPVEKSEWLYVDTKRIKGASGKPAQAKGMKKNPDKKRYRYQVDLICIDPVTRDTHQVVVDPDVWLD